MHQRRLYKTIESFVSNDFKSDAQLLKHVVNEIVKNENISIQGGRIWQFETSTESYRLLHQIGVIEKIEPGYRIVLAEYPVFVQLGMHRSIIARETDKYLRKKGILKYSATGVGDRQPSKNGPVYQYVLAFNSEELDHSHLSELNIISLALTARLKGKKIEQKAKLLERDIDKAREIQQSILPQPALDFHNYALYGMSIPDRIVGGDFFDYLFGDEERDRLSVFIADAASKGFRAASQALYVVGALRMGISYHTKISSLVARINSLVNSTFSEEQFVSMFYAEFADDQKGLLLYCNAGHNSPVLYHAHDRRIEMLEATGQVLGPFPQERFRVENTRMALGDILVMYTDGISEATDSNDELYGERRIAEKVEEYAEESAEAICKAILEDVQTFSKGSENTDDKTVVIVKRVH
ncbi:MAG: serine/threonine-protein phosphatase [Ignavibacteriae bacterium]|nr:serine/threonine-protein phosphatase [Ignavibacteriota bacterium]